MRDADFDYEKRERTRKLTIRLINKSFVLDFWEVTKVDEQAEFFTCGFQIIDDLLSVFVVQGFDCLDFNYDFIEA